MTNIECFVPSMAGEDLETTVNSFSRSSAFSGVTFLSGVSLRQTETLRSIAEAVSHKYILIYTKDTPLEMGMFALDRFLSVAEDTGADMLYADHYELIEGEGGKVRRRHPLIDCQIKQQCQCQRYEFTPEIPADEIYDRLPAGLFLHITLPPDFRCFWRVLRRREN